MHNLRHFSQWVHMGFPELLDKIARGLLRVHRPISASLCGNNLGAGYCNLTVLVASQGLSDQSA